MKKVWVAISIIVVIAIGLGIWFIATKDDKLEVSTNNVEAKSTDDLKETNSVNGSWILQLQDDVFVGYEIQELFGGDSVKKTAVGKSSAVSGTLLIENNSISKAEIIVDMTQLQSDSSSRDSKMNDQGLETNNFPEAKFVANPGQSLSGKIKKNADVPLTLKGELTLHGVTKAVSVDTTVKWDGKVIVLTGEYPISLSDYDISPPDSGFVKVDDNGKLKFQLLFFPQEN